MLNETGEKGKLRRGEEVLARTDLANYHEIEETFKPTAYIEGRSGRDMREEIKKRIKWEHW